MEKWWLFNHNKKANVFDAFDAQRILGAFIFIIIVVGVVVINFFNEASTMAIFQTNATSGVVSAGQNFGTYFDWVYPVCLLVLMVFSMVAASKIPSDSGFFIIALLLIPFIGFIISLMAEILQNIWEFSTFSVMTAQMPITSFMLTGSVPLITGIIYMILTLIPLYAGKSE